MPGTFYLALSSSGLTTLVLTDRLNYSIDEANGWAPQIVTDSNQTRVIETITVNIQGKTVEGGPDDPYLVRRNLSRLTEMLRQIERGLWGEGSPVILSYTTPNSNPARVIESMLLKWDASTYLPPDYNSARNLTTNTVEQVTITVERRHPWTLQSYTYPNLLAASAWISNPSWSAGTYTSTSAALPYGGSGYLSIPSGTTTTAPAGTTFDIVGGQTYTIVFTAVRTTGAATTVSLVLRNAASSADASTVAGPISITNSGTVTSDGQRYSTTVVATGAVGVTSGNVRLRITTTGAVQIGEILVMGGSIADEVWHPQYTEDTLSGVSPASTPGVLTVPWQTSMRRRSPVKMTVYPYASNTTTRADEGMIGATSGTITIQNYPQGGLVGTFSSTAATNAPVAGTALRYTPASTAQVEMPIDIIANLRRFQIWAVVRNTSATTSFQLQPAARSTLNTTYRVWGDKCLIGPQATITDPVVIKVGEMTVTARTPVVELWVEASAASGNLDLSTVVLVENTDDTVCIKHNATDTTGLTSTPLGLIADPLWTTSLMPSLEATNSNLSASVVTETADLPLFWTRGTSMKVIWLGVSGASWVQTDNAGAPVNVGVSATRLPAYDAPL